MNKSFDKFLLLVWKNLLLQWRHPIQTIVEIATPIVFSVLLVIVRSLVEVEPHSARFFWPFPTSLGSLDNRPYILPWSPASNPNLTEIMRGVVDKLNWDIGKPNLILWPCNNSIELDNVGRIGTNLFSLFAAVQFKDELAGQNGLPPDLHVTIRFPGELHGTQGTSTWRTDKLFPDYQVPGPRSWRWNNGASPSYNGQGFLKLQQELSLSIIKYFKPDFNSKSPVEILMKRFDYPKWSEDVLLQAFESFIGLVVMLSFVYTCISTVKAITVEKEKQLKIIGALAIVTILKPKLNTTNNNSSLQEAMKIMGLPGWLHWTAWFIKTFTLLFPSVIIMVILLKAKWYPNADYTIFTHSNPFVIFVFLLLFVLATITFCFAISVFFSKANIAATMAGLAWFLSYFPYSLTVQKYFNMSVTEKLLGSLLSNTAMSYGFKLIIGFEANGEGMQWGNIWETTSPDDNLKLGYLMIMLVVDALLYLLIALYVEAIFPGDYGVPQPWYFPFTKSYWCGKPTESFDHIEEIIDSDCFEKEPIYLQSGIKITHLRKEFSKNKVAVHDLCLNMYKDQITVLLGHNGAGKTTTMSMLTGMLTPSSGTAIVGGYDVRTDIAGVRESVGLCPQHNILFDELTVKEHLYFYCRLKGLSKVETQTEIEKYIKLLELVPKADSLSSTLSGGMKRKLSVAVAFCGGSSVVMCDEPTAGMDPGARRSLWDLLQSQKLGRTILLSTHFMDEADLLGDRIAIMAGGNLKCCGSSYFLKKKYGAGYHLIMDKSSDCDVEKVTSLLEKYIPDIKMDTHIGSELTYILNESDSHIFETMLSDLEEHGKHLGISSYGISLTTLEEVFMKVGASHDQDVTSDDNTQDNDVLGDTNMPESKVNMGQQLLSGWSLWRNQFWAMLIKHYLSNLRSWFIYGIHNLLGILFLALTIVVIRNTGSFDQLPKFKFSLDSYLNPITVLTHENDVNNYSTHYKNILNQSKNKYIDWGNESMSINIRKETTRSPSAVRLRYIAGASFTDNSIIAHFNNDPYNSPPLALQLVMNSIFKGEMSHVSDEYNLQIYFHPFPFTSRTKFLRLMQGNNFGFQLAFNIGFSMAFISAFYVLFYVRERSCKAKHLQFVAGVQVVPFWGSAFICDLITFIFTSVMVLVTLVIFQERGYKTAEELGRFFSILLYFGFSMLPMMYLSSYWFDTPSTGYIRMVFLNIFTGCGGFLVIQILGQPELDLKNVADGLHWAFLLIPHYSLTNGIKDMYVTYYTRTMCDLLSGIITPKECIEIPSYYGWKTPGIGRNVIFSLGMGVIFIAILLAIEYRLFETIINKMWNSNRKPPTTTSQEPEDSDVLMEKQKISSLSLEEINNSAVVIHNMTKYYKNFLAVDSLCLKVDKHECFGLLGMNGAGKTTTFKMMTGDVRPSSGDAWISGLSIKSNMKRIYQMIGYCPQFDALLTDLTCKETIVIFGLLRGLSCKECEYQAENLAKQFDFYKHLNKKVKELSGGNKRKLSTSLALIGDPLVIYLDEPTTGMDPATKRYLWNALCNVRDRGKCIILTSHSMEECEALCTRLTIMVNGTFKCLGSTQHLKSKFAKGYTLIIKMKKNSNFDEIEEFVKKAFCDAIIRERHQELITFYIPNNSQPWSRMFGIMEASKHMLNIEDYSIGQSSLEQVFLSFTKYQLAAQK